MTCLTQYQSSLGWAASPSSGVWPPRIRACEHRGTPSCYRQKFGGL